MSPARTTDALPKHRTTRSFALRCWSRRNLAFLLVVVLPTALAALYYYVIAAPQYVSEAQFVVRGQGSAPTGVLTSLLQTASGGSSASEDTYAVQDFMISRDAASQLIASDNLRAVFDRPEADALARFSRPLAPINMERFLHYYQNHVVAELDTTTGISTLTVRTFRPADSQQVATALLAAAERLINQMNQRQRQNMIRSAADEVQQSENKLRDISGRIAAYRNREALLDPTKQSVPMLHDVNDLQTMLTMTQMQMQQIFKSAPHSPVLDVYRRRADVLQQQIASASGRITGSDSSLVPKITAFDDLTLQRELEEKQLAAAALALSTAKAQADRQQLFLEEITQPNLADYPTYPRALASIAVIFASVLGVFLLGRLMVAGVREHQLQ